MARLCQLGVGADGVGGAQIEPHPPGQLALAHTIEFGLLHAGGVHTGGATVLVGVTVGVGVAQIEPQPPGQLVLAHTIEFGLLHAGGEAAPKTFFLPGC